MVSSSGLWFELLMHVQARCTVAANVPRTLRHLANLIRWPLGKLRSDQQTLIDIVYPHSVWHQLGVIGNVSALETRHA